MKKLFSLLILFSVTLSALSAQGLRRDSLMNYSRDNYKNAAVGGITREKQYEYHRMQADFIQDVDANAAKNTVLDISSTLLSTGNTPYAGKFIRENNSATITCFIDKSGVKHLINRQATVGNSGVPVSASDPNSDFRGSFVKEGGQFITAYVDAYGVRHSIGVDGSLYATTANLVTETAARTAADAAITTNTEAVYQKKVAFATANNIAYISKKYTTVGDGAWIEQKNAAVVGSPVATFPNPLLAMQAITAKLVNKEIERGFMVVMEGNVYTVAENTDTAGLGNFDYVYRNISTNTAFHPFPSSTSRVDDDSLCMSLAFPNLDVIFMKGSGITHKAGRGVIMFAYDTIAPQRISGSGSFVLNVTNDRTNNGSGLGNNINATAGGSRGEIEFSGDSLKIGRLSPEYSGWTMLNASSSTKSTFIWRYVSNYENNSLFRSLYNSTVLIDKFTTDTTVAPYKYLNNPYSSTSSFNLGNNCTVKINEAYIASNYLLNVTSSVTCDVLINRLSQKLRAAYQTEMVGTNASAIPQGTGASGLAVCAIGFNYINSTAANATITVNNYRGTSPVLMMTGSGVIKRCNIKFNFGSVYQDSIQNDAITPKTSIYSAFTGSIDSSIVEINANIINAATHAIVIENNNKIKYSGTYKTLSAVKAPILVNGNNANTLINGNIITQGTQASIEGAAGSTITCLPSSTANTAASSNVTVNGVLNVNAAYKQ